MRPRAMVALCVKMLIGLAAVMCAKVVVMMLDRHRDAEGPRRRFRVSAATEL